MENVENNESVEKKLEKALNEKIIEIDTSDSGIEGLKDAYLSLQEKYSLPDFDLLNENFSIEKLQGEDTDFLIREVRRYISDKFGSYLRLIESLLQPSNAQMFVFMMLKTLSSDDNSKLQEIYKRLARKEIEVIELDLKFDVDKEATFINSAFDMWEEIKIEILAIMDKVKTNWGNGSSSSNPRRYFG